MKYIRTSDGRIVDTEKEYLKCSDNYGIQARDYALTIGQAATIEALCDGILVEEIGNEDNWFFMETSEFCKTPIEDKKYQSKSWVFNAFIKTKKGLIYVARMNSEGVLELIWNT